MFQQKRSPYTERTGRSEHGGTKTARYVSPNTDLCAAITEWTRVPRVPGKETTEAPNGNNMRCQRETTEVQQKETEIT